MKKIKKYSRTGTERSSELSRKIESLGGSGGAAYRSSASKRPDILKNRVPGRGGGKQGVSGDRHCHGVEI